MALFLKCPDLSTTPSPLRRKKHLLKTRLMLDSHCTLTAADLPQAQEVHKPEHPRPALCLSLQLGESGGHDSLGKVLVVQAAAWSQSLAAVGQLQTSRADSMQEEALQLPKYFPSCSTLVTQMMYEGYKGF